MRETVDLINLLFLSMDQIIHLGIFCHRDDIFSRVVEKLLNQYPEYRKKKLEFMAHGQRIKEYLSVEDNNLLDNDKVIIIVIEWGEEDEYSNNKSF